VRDLPFELQPATSATIEDLDAELFRRTYLPASVAPEVIEENNRSLAPQLASLGFARAGEPTIPTYLGVLAIAIEPRQFVPGDYIQFLRIDGTGLTDPIKDQSEIAGPLPTMLRMIDDKLHSNISTATDVTGNDTEFRRPDYPLPALQQLLRNAVLHRSYDASNAPVRVYWFSDRIEIHSPGGPFGIVNASNFGMPGVTDYRNANLAGVMKNLGYVQRFGMGIQIARKQLADNGSPPPEFLVTPDFVLTTIRRPS
jgi:ATP-dependent DNA helicase RecG